MAKAKQATVEEKLKALYKLQSIDTQIDKIKILRGELPLEVQDLEDEIKLDEERLSRKKEKADKLSQQVIPEIMESMKMKTMKLRDGSSIEIKEI